MSDNPTTAIKTFIRVVETWVPSADGSLLEFGGGVFGGATRFQAATERLCFGRGEGLPGQAWELGRPIVLNDLEGSYFRRAAAARAEGLTSGIAVPIFVDGALTSVTIIFCGDDASHAGAIELWANDPEEGRDMTLVDGYYGSTGDTFEFISRSTAFRKGTGLPGMAWEAQLPVFLPDLGKASGFLRGDGAVKVGINRGFAIPCSTSDGTHCVMAFLSALATPIARKVEVWQSDPAGTLRRTFGFSEDDGVLPDGGGVAEGLVAQACGSGVTAIDGSVVAVPIAPQGRITAVMALTL